MKEISITLLTDWIIEMMKFRFTFSRPSIWYPWSHSFKGIFPDYFNFWGTFCGLFWFIKIRNRALAPKNRGPGTYLFKIFLKYCLFHAYVRVCALSLSFRPKGEYFSGICVNLNRWRSAKMIDYRTDMKKSSSSAGLLDLEEDKLGFSNQNWGVGSRKLLFDGGGMNVRDIFSAMEYRLLYWGMH